MAYSNVWNSASPPGSQAANTADDEFRKFRVDIEERMEDKFITDVVVDPWVVKPEILGNVVGKRYMLHHSAFTPDAIYDIPTAQPTFTRVALYVEHISGDANIRTLQAPLHIPPGATITGIDYLVNRNGAGNMGVKFSSTGFNAAPAYTNIASTVTASNGIVILSLAPTYVVLNSEMLFLEITFPVSQASRLYGAKVIYNTPDCRNTL